MFDMYAFLARSMALEGLAVNVSGKHAAGSMKKSDDGTPVDRVRLRALAERGRYQPQIISSDEVRELARSILRLLDEECQTAAKPSS